MLTLEPILYDFWSVKNNFTEATPRNSILLNILGMQLVIISNADYFLDWSVMCFVN